MIRKVGTGTARQLSACQLYADNCDIVYELLLFALPRRPKSVTISMADQSMIRIGFDAQIGLKEIEDAFVRDCDLDPTEEWSRLAFLKEVCFLEISTPHLKGSTRGLAVLNVGNGSVEFSGGRSTETTITVKDPFKNYPVRWLYLQKLNQPKLMGELITKLAVLNPTVKITLVAGRAILLESIPQPKQLGELEGCLASLIGLFPVLSRNDFLVYRDDDLLLVTLKRATLKKECWVFSVNNRLCEFNHSLRRTLRRNLPDKAVIVLKLTLPDNSFEVYKREAWLYQLPSVEAKLHTAIQILKENNERSTQRQEEDEATVRRIEQLTSNYKRVVGKKIPPRPVPASQQQNEQSTSKMATRIRTKAARINQTQSALSQGCPAEDSPSTQILVHPQANQPQLFANLSKMVCIGQYAKGFFVAHLDGCLYLIDQHAASEKVLYEQYIAEKPESYSKIFEMELPAELAPVVQESKAVLSSLGWQYEPVASPSRLLRLRFSRTPYKLKFSFGEKEFLQTLQSLRTHPTRLPLSIQHQEVQRIAAKAACSNSYKIQEVVDLQSMNKLLQALSLISSPQSCPHGRPTISELNHIGKLSVSISQPRVYSI